MVSVMEESVIPDYVLDSPIRDASHDDHNDDSNVSMIDSDSDSSMDVSAPDLSMMSSVTGSFMVLEVCNESSVLVPAQEHTSEREIKAT